MSNIARVYARLIDGSLAHVWITDYGTPEVNTVLVVRFDIETYPTLYQTLTDNVKAIHYLNNELVLDNVPILTAAEIATRNAEVLATEQTVNDTHSLRAFAALAQQHSKPIHALFTAITNADVQQHDTATRFSAIAEIIEDTAITSNAFKVRFNAAFTAESGVSVAGLNLTQLLLLTTGNKQRYISFARYFTLHYGVMLDWAG